MEIVHLIPLLSNFKCERVPTETASADITLMYGKVRCIVKSCKAIMAGFKIGAHGILIDVSTINRP